MIVKDINLLPVEIINARKSIERTRLILLISVLIVVCIFSFMVVNYTEILGLKERKTQLTDLIKQAREIEDVENVVAADTALLYLRQNVLSVVEDSGDNTLEILEEIESLMPKKLFFLNMSFSKDSITLSGVAASNIVVADLIKSVKDLGIFEDVFVPSLTSQGKGLLDIEVTEEEKKEQPVSFSMNCTLKGAEGK